SGRISGLLPGQRGYVQAALDKARRVTLFGRHDRTGAAVSLELPGGRYFGFYLIPNSTTAAWDRVQAGHPAGKPPLPPPPSPPRAPAALPRGTPRALPTPAGRPRDRPGLGAHRRGRRPRFQRLCLPRKLRGPPPHPDPASNKPDDNQPTGEQPTHGHDHPART